MLIIECMLTFSLDEGLQTHWLAGQFLVFRIGSELFHLVIFFHCSKNQDVCTLFQAEHQLTANGQ